MSFFDIGGQLINLNHVRCVRRNLELGKVTLVYADGSSSEFTGYKGNRACDDTNDLENLMAPIIPANAGFELLHFWFNDEEEPSVATVVESCQRQPVIGWRIKRYGDDHYDAEPVVLDPPFHFSGVQSVLRPDGVVTDVDCTSKDINAWAEYVCRRWQAWRKEEERENKANTKVTDPVA